MGKRSYLICLFFFKVAVGSLLILIGWDVLGISKDSPINIALVTGLSFLPATLAKPFYNRLQHLSEPLTASVLLFITSLLVLLESIYFLKKVDNIYLFFGMHFFLWTFIFLIESFLERWFIRLSQNISESGVSDLSGISMALIQVGILLGPILVGLMKSVSFFAPYISTSVLLLMSAVPGYLVLNESQRRTSNQSNKYDFNLSPENGTQVEWLFIVSFSIIWPTIAVFNMAVPLLVQSKLQRPIWMAVILEVALAFGTATIGLLISKFKWKQMTSELSIVGLALSVFVSVLSLRHLPIFVISVYLIGFFYGHLRIVARTNLAKRFDVIAAGRIISSANAFSAPLVVIFLSISYFEFVARQSFVSSSFVFLFSGIFFYLTQRVNRHV